MPTLLTLSFFFSSLFAVSFGAVFTSGTPDTVTVRGAYSAPALSFSSNADFTITQFSQYLSPNTASNFFNGVVFIADIYSQEILFTSEEFPLSNAGAGWYNSPQLNWNLEGPVTQYSIGLMVDVPASYYYTVSETNTDGTLTSYFDNGNFEGNFDSADFTCCGEINLFSSITYTTSSPNTNSTTFTAGSATSYSYRGYYDASALNFRANKPVYLTQVAQYIDPQGYSIGYQFQGMVVLANLNTTSVIYNSPVFNLTVNGAGFYSSPNINVELDPTIEYAVGIIVNIYADYYYGYGIQTDGTLTAYPSNANIAGSFTSQTISCCAAATIYMQLTYTSSEDNAKNFSSGGIAYNNYRAAYYPAALNFKANTDIVITQVSQYISPQVTTGTSIGAMVVVGNLNSSTIEYNSPIFTLYADGATWYTSPSVNIPLYANTNYVIAIMTNVSTNIYYTLDSGNTDGTVTSYSRNANFMGNFDSQTIDCCYSADIATQFLYTAGTPPPPPTEYTFVSGDETYTSYRSGFFAAALNFVTNTPITIDQVSQYLEPSLGNIAAMAIIANLNTSQIIYNSPTFVLANNGSSWYSIPVNFPVYPGVNYGIGIMLNVSNTIFYSGAGNTDGTITSFAHNANFGGNFGNQTIDCCYGANIYTQIVYSENSENVITQIEEVFKRFNSFDR